MAEKRKKKTAPQRVEPLKVAVTESIPTRARFGADLDRREDFGENTFAGALAAVKNVLEHASDGAASRAKSKKK